MLLSAWWVQYYVGCRIMNDKFRSTKDQESIDFAVTNYLSLETVTKDRDVRFLGNFLIPKGWLTREELDQAFSLALVQQEPPNERGE